MNMLKVARATLADKTLHMIMLGIFVTLMLALVVPWGAGKHYYFYQALTIVVCAGSGVSDTYQSARSRIWATCFGLGVGTVAASILPMSPWMAIVGYVAVFFIAERFGWQEYINAGGSMFLVVYLYHNAAQHENVFVYSGWRLLHTLVGIIIILLLSRLYLKNDASGYRQLVIQTDSVGKKLLLLIKQILQDDQKIQESHLEKLKRDLLEIEKLAFFLAEEHKLHSHPPAGFVAVTQVIARMDELRIMLYYLWAYSYKPEQLDAGTRGIVEAGLMRTKPWNERRQVLYTNNLAVRKLVEGYALLGEQLQAMQIVEVTK